jgi:hypothetical protein
MSVQLDVDRGLIVRAEIARLQEELRLIEGRLEKAGLAGEQIPLQEADREGRQYLAKGSIYIVPVLFTADAIVAGFEPDGLVHMQLRDSVGLPAVNGLFKLRFVSRFPDGQKFRAAAREMLGPRAPGCISICLSRDKTGVPKSRTVIAWDRARARGEGEAK